MPRSKKSSQNTDIQEMEASKEIAPADGTEGIEKGLSIEESFDYLDEAVEMLENGSLSLEESFKVYKNAMKVIKECGKQIDETEKKVMLISGDGEEEGVLDE